MSAHGTNPASAQMAGLQVVPVNTSDNGDVDIKDFESKAKADHTSFVKELGKEVNREKILVDIIQSIDLAIQKQINL